MEKQRDINNLNVFSERETVMVSSEPTEADYVDRKCVYRFLKRLIDIISSFFGLIILAPLFLIVAIIIKKEEINGPVFFSQTRIGKNGKSFKMYKFRSMCVDAEEKLNELMKFNEIDGAMFKMKNDPRVTKIGGFLRKYSLDELPQLINVIKGDMSLVGPRPPLAREVKEYKEKDYKRLLVKPGITGLWQVSGRSSLSFDEMVNLDLEYIKKMSVCLDTKILIKTIKVVLIKENAY